MTLAFQTLATTPVVGALTVEALLILFALAGAVLFVVAYPVLSDPRVWTREGWHMWLFTLFLVSLGGSSITRRLWPSAVDHPAYTVAILITYAVLGVLVWQRVWLLVTARRYDEKQWERAQPRAHRLGRTGPTPPGGTP